MDATLAWTIVGSCAGVAGVTVAAVATFRQSRSGRKIDSKVTAELGVGQLDRTGVLCVRFASGKMNITNLPKPGETKASREDSSEGKPPETLEFTPVNAIFVHNESQAGVTVSRCQYSSNLGGVGFVFEPQPGASERGDLLPKSLGPGEEAVLIHNWATMRVFLNHVLLDHDVEEATFQIVLTLGNGKEILVFPSMHIQVDMCEHQVAESLATHGGTLVRQELAEPPTLPGLMTKGLRWRRRAN